MLANKLKNLKILSFNWHEPYLCLLAETSHHFTIVEPEVKKDFTMRWRKELRLLPDNITLMDKEAALSELEAGAFDLAICQNVKDLVFIKDFLFPKILVFHNKLSTEIALGRNQVKREEYLAPLRDIFSVIKLVFISENKMKDWGFKGEIITPGINVKEYGGYSGDIQKVLRVGNMIKERNLMMGYTTQEEILKNIPNTLMGENPTIPESRVSKNWEELKSLYKNHRLFLNTTVNQYEDGYNLAMLEAMATGMPVISTANDTSPIVNGENGFISDDIQYLGEKIAFLLENKEEAKRIGQNGRETVKENFRLEKFVEKWETAITGTVKAFVSKTLTDKTRTGRLEINENFSKDKSKTIFKEIREKSFISPDAGSSLEKTENYFNNVREDIISLIPSGIKKVLDVGCAAGSTGKKIKESGVPFVAGIEKDEEAGKEAEKYLDAVHTGDIETISISYPEKFFDCILCADILEHLINPSRVLKKLRKYLHEDGVIIASIPNVQYFEVMLNLAEGNWTYVKEGILDETHLRFFTLNEIKKLFQNSGFEILEIEAAIDPQYNNYPAPKRDQLKFGKVLIQNLKEEEFKEFFVYQYKILAKKVVNKELQDILDNASQLQNENIEKAIEMFKDAESKFPENEELLLKLGACMLVTNQIEKSGKYYKKAEKLNPNSSKALTGLGFLEIQKGNLNAASDYFLKAITRDSSNDIAIYGEGICLWNKGEKKKGLQRYCDALDINIENMQVLTSLTEAVYEIGSFEVIERYFKEYLTLHPANLNMLFSLAGIQFKLGKINEAKENLENILVFDPTRNDAIQLMEIIKSQFKQGKTG